MQETGLYPHQQAYENTLLEYWCVRRSHRTNSRRGAGDFALSDFEVRSELATYDTVPRVRQERFEIGIRRNKNNRAAFRLHFTGIGRSPLTPLELLTSSSRAIQNNKNQANRTGGCCAEILY